jgi:hypothetical protein
MQCIRTQFMDGNITSSNIPVISVSFFNSIVT